MTLARTSALASLGSFAVFVYAGAGCGTHGGAVNPEVGADGIAADAGVASGDVVVSDGPVGDGGNPSRDACEPAPPPSPPAFPGGPPADLGCYLQVENGWQRIPCNCDLSLENASHAKVDVQLTLTVSPADVHPVLSGSPAAELRFADQDSIWYDVWVNQTGSGTDFAVTRLDGSTIVRLGADLVTLDPVPMDACQSRMGKASVTGVPPWAALNMRATVRDSGDKVSLIVGSCVNVPRM